MLEKILLQLFGLLPDIFLCIGDIGMFLLAFGCVLFLIAYKTQTKDTPLSKVYKFFLITGIVLFLLSIIFAISTENYNIFSRLIQTCIANTLVLLLFYGCLKTKNKLTYKICLSIFCIISTGGVYAILKQPIITFLQHTGYNGLFFLSLMAAAITLISLSIINWMILFLNETLCQIRDALKNYKITL